MKKSYFGLSKKWRASGVLAGTLILMAGSLAKADTETASPSTQFPNDGIITQWLNFVTKIQSEQPDWATPVMTTTPLLEQEFRYDQSWESGRNGNDSRNFGGGKGIEFIPAQNIEAIIGIPAYETHDKPKGNEGFADENLLFKYRLLSANAEHGDYILTAFLGLTLPTGSKSETDHEFTTTPTIAFGKGWGAFDVQDTLGISIPTIGPGVPRNNMGTPVAWNTTFQYQLFKHLWPEVEFNYTWFPNGEHAGLNQLFVTPGLVLGKFSIDNRFGCTIGVAYQIAVTENPTYNNNLILTVRLPF